MKKTLIILFTLFIGWTIIAFSWTSVTERARHSYEEGNFCESYKWMKWAAFFSKDYKKFLGLFYACGFCIPQDIEKAKDLYIKSGKVDNIGEKLFYDKLELLMFNKIQNKQLNSPEVEQLSMEIDKLGYLPNEKQKSLLNNYTE